MVLELAHEVLQLMTWYMGRCELADELRKPWSGMHGTQARQVAQGVTTFSVVCVVRCEVVHAQVCMYVYVSVYSK